MSAIRAKPRCGARGDLIANALPERGLLTRPGGGVVTQRTANPCTPVRFRLRPPNFHINPDTSTHPHARIGLVQQAGRQRALAARHNAAS